MHLFALQLMLQWADFLLLMFMIIFPFALLPDTFFEYAGPRGFFACLEVKRFL